MPGQEKFPRSERLTRRQDFLDLYRSGDKYVGREFICYTAREEGIGRKFGVAVSRKVGGAVTRNRVKRYIREVYRESRQQMSDNLQMVVVARPAAAKMNFHECHDAIGRLFRKGKVLRD